MSAPQCAFPRNRPYGSRAISWDRVGVGLAYRAEDMPSQCSYGFPFNCPGEPQLAHPYYPAERCADAVRRWPAGSRAPHVHECRGALRRTRRCKAR